VSNCTAPPVVVVGVVPVWSNGTGCGDGGVGAGWTGAFFTVTGARLGEVAVGGALTAGAVEDGARRAAVVTDGAVGVTAAVVGVI
jgi:hypothetical protein